MERAQQAGIPHRDARQCDPGSTLLLRPPHDISFDYFPMTLGMDSIFDTNSLEEEEWIPRKHACLGGDLPRLVKALGKMLAIGLDYVI